MFRKTFGAAMIVAGGFIAEDAAKDFAAASGQYLDKATNGQSQDLSDFDNVDFGSGLMGGLLIVLGASGIAGAARKKLLGAQTIHPSVEARLQELNAETIENAQEINKQTISSLKKVANALKDVDQRLAGELSVDIASLEQATAEIGKAEDASTRVIKALETIENSANAHIAMNTPDGALERLSIAQANYRYAQANILTACKSAMANPSARVGRYPDRFNEILAQASILNNVVLDSDSSMGDVQNASQNMMQTVTTHLDYISEKIVKAGMNPGKSAPHFVEVSSAATKLSMASSEYAAAQNTFKAVLATQPHETPEANAQTAAPANDDFAENEDGMIVVEGYGAIPANLTDPHL